MATSTARQARRPPAWLNLGQRPSNAAPENPSESELAATLEGSTPRYTSPDETFAIWSAVRDDGTYFTLQGPLARCAGGEMLSCRGRWKNHPKHGWSFVVDAYESALPQSREGIKTWLQARVPGIGPVFAQAIADTYGERAFEVIDADPSVLYDLRTKRGTKISSKQVDSVIAAWGEIRTLRQIETWLFGAGITAKLAARLYQRYGDNVIAVLEDNPYQISEIPRIGFKIADKIALKLGMGRDDPRRVRAGLRFVLEEAESDGHSFLTLEQLFLRAAATSRGGKDEGGTLAVGDRVLVAQVATEMAAAGEIIVEADPVVQQRVYRSHTYEIEKRLARRVRDLAAPAPRLMATLTRPQIPDGMTADEARQKHIYVPTDEQWSAVEMCVANRLALLTGGPGVGKSASQDMLIQALKKANLRVLLCAPTGKAARRMTELTGEIATTVHRLLEWSPIEGGFTRDESNPLEADVVICDEASMLSLDLADALIAAIGPQTHLLLVGDPDQLPPVGVGKFLSDLIDSGAVARVHLTTIFRQAAGSMIIANAHRINSGTTPFLTHAQAEQDLGREMLKDMFWIGRKSPEESAELAVEFAVTRIPRTYGLDPVRDIMVLAPMHSGACGLDVLNGKLQEALNPHGKAIGVKNIRRGDRIVQNRNDYTPGRETVNGQLGVVADFDPETTEATIELDDERRVMIPASDMETWSLAWAMTVHKSQGSQWPAVVTPVSKAHYVMLSRALTYTAVTRAQKVVVMVGERVALEMAVKNNDSGKRNSTLPKRITDPELSGELF